VLGNGTVLTQTVRAIVTVVKELVQKGVVKPVVGDFPAGEF
jgi:hypothetical protein